MDASKNRALLLDTIRKNGKQNAHYKDDVDITYGELQALLNDKVGGLMALLKAMKRENVLSYNEGGMLKPDTVITLNIADSSAEHISEQVAYENIKDHITAADKTSHTRVVTTHQQ
eukprot:TRINITY_DN8097_c0_g1_i1.p1 TRINITY_DN8097_c0_g1~~TRINITY_DN8097_c0_g1_i1.p1  ORF type:complete len:116 (-),score=29.14 TRINITY_DN8097_c0_g1_i1:6-353(-)